MGKINKEIHVLGSTSPDGKHTTAFVSAPCTLYVDVDNTLVFLEDPNQPEDPSKEGFLFDHFGTTVRLIPHKQHIRMLREFKARGHGVIVWSTGGAEWAKQVVEALGLLPFVDVIVRKPDWVLDDKPVKDWMGERFYIDPVTGKSVEFGRNK